MNRGSNKENDQQTLRDDWPSSLVEAKISHDLEAALVAPVARALVDMYTHD
ncbi:TPA: hypothetical protein TT574_000382 [Streptococcus equi subsp. zooepidemicus]|uniref:hypothetical protein n=1 Tax=Streptococcus equi TaxID=1336 RepID=UPI001E5C961F|nr:hypothetical protein [Streptococcus equi]MCD3373429.1 hypothetical protein [Streptococcus equi subsp. zooepidemicus]MDI5951394.1 hypothetical protein [Streptococcus equi subsp. zooepidemicus]MDI6073193.1 hypothetical protein [Streptococcus equi subsp. zooepidemicus]HEK9954582.1 hypothetical protein [Streptococcus equi subsp. zooepidemicus]HEK9992239.1 hypothetical protein [Streptococcus equi subsp. zooepidemicus]